MQENIVTTLQLKGLDISIYSYTHIEKGTQNPTFSLLFALCNILNCDMNTVFNLKDIKSE